MTGPVGNEIYDRVPFDIATAHCIKIRREYLGLEQGQLAGKCGFTQPKMSRLEAGITKVDVAEFALIARALNLMPSDLMCIVENAAGWSP